MARTKSLRPKNGPPPAHRAARLLLTLGRPGPGELDALLEGVEAEQVLAAASHLSSAELADAAFGAYLGAYEVWQMCSREQRARITGCSLQLLALALDQALALHKMSNELAERTEAQEQAKRELAQRVAAAEIRCAQARGILLKVAADEVHALFAGRASPGDPARELLVVAEVARALLRGAPPAVALRATLYGLDRAFIDGQEQLSKELAAHERLAHASVFTEDQWRALRRAQVTTWLLANHFVDAFAAATAVDKSIPALKASIRRAPALAPPDAPHVPESTRRLGVPHPHAHAPHAASPLRIPRVNGR